MIPSSSRVFPNVASTTTNAVKLEGMGVEASLGADAYWELLFVMPPTLPSGTGKLNMRAVANATSGAAKINPKWVSVAEEETLDLAAGSFFAEGVQTITWAASDNWQPKASKVTLDADTLVANEFVLMRITMETSGWTLAQIMTLIDYSIIWE